MPQTNVPGLVIAGLTIVIGAVLIVTGHSAEGDWALGGGIGAGLGIQIPSTFG